jgi:hypothetical protein
LCTCCKGSASIGWIVASLPIAAAWDASLRLMRAVQRQGGVPSNRQSFLPAIGTVTEASDDAAVRKRRHVLSTGDSDIGHLGFAIRHHCVELATQRRFAEARRYGPRVIEDQMSIDCGTEFRSSVLRRESLAIRRRISGADRMQPG